MMTTRMMSVAAHDDAELVSESLAGNRDAFGQIVARYQSLVCSLAYSATGSLSQSKDVAQETFLTAWKQLTGLREPEKLRAWLCGIARNHDGLDDVVLFQPSTISGTSKFGGFTHRIADRSFHIQSGRGAGLCRLHRNPYLET